MEHPHPNRFPLFDQAMGEIDEFIRNTNVAPPAVEEQERQAAYNVLHVMLRHGKTVEETRRMIPPHLWNDVRRHHQMNMQTLAQRRIAQAVPQPVPQDLTALLQQLLMEQRKAALLNILSNPSNVLQAPSTSLNVDDDDAIMIDEEDERHHQLQRLQSLHQNPAQAIVPGQNAQILQTPPALLQMCAETRAMLEPVSSSERAQMLQQFRQFQLQAHHAELHRNAQNDPGLPPNSISALLDAQDMPLSPTSSEHVQMLQITEETFRGLLAASHKILPPVTTAHAAHVSQSAQGSAQPPNPPISLISTLLQYPQPVPSTAVPMFYQAAQSASNPKTQERRRPYPPEKPQKPPSRMTKADLVIKNAEQAKELKKLREYLRIAQRTPLPLRIKPLVHHIHGLMTPYQFDDDGELLTWNEPIHRYVSVVEYGGAGHQIQRSRSAPPGRPSYSMDATHHQAGIQNPDDEDVTIDVDVTASCTPTLRPSASTESGESSLLVSPILQSPGIEVVAPAQVEDGTIQMESEVHQASQTEKDDDDDDLQGICLQIANDSGPILKKLINKVKYYEEGMKPITVAMKKFEKTMEKLDQERKKNAELKAVNEAYRKLYGDIEVGEKGKSSEN